MKKSLLKSLETLAGKIDKEIENKLGDKTNSTTSKICDTGWTRIPNCESIVVEDGIPDEKLKALGIKVFQQTKFRVNITPYKNKNINRYMIYQVKRLIRLRESKPKVYWTVAWLLIRKSNAFRVSAIHHVLNKWEQNLPFWYVTKTNKLVSKLLNAYEIINSPKKLVASGLKKGLLLDYKRTFIPKGEDKVRPLGVPTDAWRIALHMVANMLEIFLKPRLLESQHGFISKRGVLTAWSDVITKVIKAKYIYECDLKQFFPSVHLESCFMNLKRWGVNMNTTNWLREMSHSTPAFTTILKKADIFVTPEGREITVFQPQLVYDSILSEKDKLAYSKDQIFPGGRLHNWPSGSPGPESRRQQITHGFPQGAATSPICSISILVPFLSQVPSISYADDPIFYSDEDFTIQDDPKSGIVLHPEKSSWVKRDGVWLKPLKYLGLVYDENAKTLTASSNPVISKLKSTLQLPEKYLEEILGSGSPRVRVDEDPKKKNSFSLKGSPWERLLKTHIYGLLMNRLQNGSFTLEHLEQDFKLTIGSHSWLEGRGIKLGPIALRNQINVFNASSYACHSLFGILEKWKRKKVGSTKPIRFDNFKLICLSTRGRKRNSL